MSVSSSSSSSSLWDVCNLDPVLLSCIDDIETRCTPYNNDTSSSSVVAPSSSSSSVAAPSSSSVAAPSSSSRAGVDSLQTSLSSAEVSCKDFMEELDNILGILDEVSNSYRDVTGRTNSLMHSCESLLEQQHTLQATSEILKTTLAPFDDVEDIASLLGIPIDTRTSASNTAATTNNAHADPRSSEFQTALEKIAKTLVFVNQHPEFRDNERYHRWLIQLQNRATSIVARGMKELLENAKKACIDILHLQKLKNNATNAAAGNKARTNPNPDEQPLEASPIYQKFRGLGFRMRELSVLLYIGHEKETKRSINDNDNNGNGNNIHTANDILRDVKQTYILIRSELLMPFMRDTTLSVISLPSSSSSSTLCSGIRHAYSTLLRITQLEFQLADSLFNAQDDPKVKDGSNSSSNSNGTIKPSKDYKGSDGSDQTEVYNIVTAICNATGDYLRPLIIRESDVDELCRVVTTLAEDVKTQILALNVPKPVIKEVMRSLNRTVSDTQERLSYCAEIKVRQDIQLFEPTLEHLAYPDILEKNATVNDDEEVPETLDVISKTWYPPLRATLALLSKLYGVVEVFVFEDFARRSIDFCVATLKVGSDQLKKKKLKDQGQMHGDLFLVRHLLLLREQLIPFDIRLQGIEKKLDFKPTGAAFTHFAKNSRSLLRLDVTNSFIQLAWEGLPGLQETQFDARKDLDYVLKNACLSLKLNAVKMLLGPTDAFLSKVVAFVGEIPISSSSTQGMLAAEDSTLLLSVDNRQLLKNQAFVRAERIKEVLQQAKEQGNQSGLQLQSMMTLYVENNIARTILLKPIQQEIDNTKKRLICVINSCVDPGQPLRDLDQLLNEFVDTILSHLC